jgi:hypothetical protein
VRTVEGILSGEQSEVNRRREVVIVSGREDDLSPGRNGTSLRQSPI